MESNQNNKKPVILYALLCVCVTAAIFFAAVIVKELYIRGQGKSFYASVSASARGDARTVDNQRRSVAGNAPYTAQSGYISSEVTTTPNRAIQTAFVTDIYNNSLATTMSAYEIAEGIAASAANTAAAGSADAASANISGSDIVAPANGTTGPANAVAHYSPAEIAGLYERGVLQQGAMQWGAMEQAPRQPGVDFAELRESCVDVVAWISCEEIGVSYPVVQGQDNEYYLKHLPNGKSSYMGSIFLDYRNSPDFIDKNSMIYGHALASGEMFTAVKKYQNQEFYDEHPLFRLNTPDKGYDIELVAGYIVDSSKAEEVPPLSFDDSAAFERYIELVKRRSTFKSDVTAGPGDLLVSLATCAYPASVYRYVLVGKLVNNWG